METSIVLLRNSERASYRRCRLRWDWSYNRRLAPVRDAGALSFGRMVHESLEAYYPPGIKRGIHPAKTFKKLYLQSEIGFDQWDDEGNKVNALELGTAMLEGYVDLWGKEDYVEIIQPELPIEVDVLDRQGHYICTWVGRSDAAYRDLRNNRIGFFEHKTAKTIDDELRINSGYGEQGLSYWWAGDIYFHHHKILKPNEHVDHVLFNWLRKHLPDDRPKNQFGHSLNKDGSVSKRQPRPLFHRYKLEFGPDEMDMINSRIRSEAWEMAQVRAGKLPIYKNPTMNCSWDCPFKDPCELHEMGQDYETMLELEYIHWNPYETHELEGEKQ
jgi:Zierdtviridae exonuclease